MGSPEQQSLAACRWNMLLSCGGSWDTCGKNATPETSVLGMSLRNLPTETAGPTGDAVAPEGLGSCVPGYMVGAGLKGAWGLCLCSSRAAPPCRHWLGDPAGDEDPNPPSVPVRLQHHSGWGARHTAALPKLAPTASQPETLESPHLPGGFWPHAGKNNPRLVWWPVQPTFVVSLGLSARAPQAGWGRCVCR